MSTGVTATQRNVWIVVALVAAAAAVGLGIWAATLKSDLDEANATTAAAQQQYEQAISATTQQLTVTSSQLEKATTDLQTAEQAAQQAATEDEKQAAQAQLDAALAENGKACSQGTLLALSRIAGGPSVSTSLDRAMQDLEAVATQCQAMLDASG